MSFNAELLVADWMPRSLFGGASGTAFDRHQRTPTLPWCSIDALEKPRHYAEESEYYRDTGCEAHDSCLTCPFDVCLEERGRREQRMMELAEQIRLRYERGETVEQIAVAVGKSLRTVYKVMHDRLPGLLQETPRASRTRESATRRRVPQEVIPELVRAVQAVVHCSGPERLAWAVPYAERYQVNARYILKLAGMNV